MTNTQASPEPQPVDPQSPPWSRTTRRVVAVIMVAIVLLLLWRFQGLLAQIIVSWLVAYLLNPVINAITARFPLSRTAVTIIVYVLMVILLIGLMGLIGVAAFNQLSDLFGRLPQFVSSAIESVGELTNNPRAALRLGPYELSLRDVDWEQLQSEAVAMINPALATGSTAAASIASGAVSVVGWFSLTFIISLYIAIDLPRFGREWDYISKQSGYNADLSRIRQELLEIGNAYLRGQVILGLVVGTLTAVLLGLLGVENALALGILSGFLELIPYFGPIISAVVAVAVAFFQDGNYLGIDQFYFTLAVLGVMILIQQIENNFLVPRIVGDALNLKPLTVLIAVIMGGSIAGLLGIILAGPVAAGIKLIGGYLWRKMLGLPPFPPEEEHPKAVEGPSLLARTIGLIRSRRRRLPGTAVDPTRPVTTPVPPSGDVVDPANPTRTVDTTPPGEGEPPKAAKH